MNSFADLSLCPILRANLDRNLFVNPTPVQAGAIPPALEGRDVVATAQTGTGKTLAFVLPLLERLMSQAPSRGVEAIVLSPTRELAMQIHQAFQLLAQGSGVSSALVVGGLNEDRQLFHIRRGARVLIATPGRLCDFLERRLVKLNTTRMIVLDEADRMLDMGFLPALTLILEAMPETHQTMLFSATLEKSVVHLIDRYVTNAARVAIGTTTAPAPEVDLHLYEVETDNKLPLLTGLLRSHQGSTLVFARTRHGADRLARRLGDYGVKAARIHGDRTQSQRNQALDGFKRGDYRVLVATDVAARGIHVDGIAHVVNFDLPQVPEDFVHRVGRTGRAGARGIASTFSTRSERGEIRRIERTLRVRLTPQTAEIPVLEPVVPVRHEVPVHTKAKPAAKPYSKGPAKFSKGPSQSADRGYSEHSFTERSFARPAAKSGPKPAPKSGAKPAAKSFAKPASKAAPRGPWSPSKPKTANRNPFSGSRPPKARRQSAY